MPLTSGMRRRFLASRDRRERTQCPDYVAFDLG